MLSSVKDADFLFLQRATGLTKGNLSSHLTKLEDAGLVTIEKRFIQEAEHERRAHQLGRKRRIADHWERLERLKAQGAE